jgi:hypothetical protein
MRPLIVCIAVAMSGLSPAIAASAPTVTPPLAAPLREGIPPSVLGLTYMDPATGVILYVETDGRHVAAISPEGKLLWLKNPFVDANLQPYRVPRPTIFTMGHSNWTPPGGTKDAFVGLGFNSSQFGVINLRTGEFTFEGQN